MRTKSLLVMMAVSAMLAGGVSVAQMGGDQTKAKAAMPLGSPMTPGLALDQPVGLLEEEMMGVVRAMPADKYSFAPAAGTFSTTQGAKFEGVRTFAEQVAHVAQANFYFYAAVSGMKPDVDMKAVGELKTKAELVEALGKSFVFAHRAVATITPENAFLTIKPIDGMNTRTSLAVFGVAHGYDHYGQMVEYLRMNGVLPPGSK